jgi:hypothetical protein
MSSSAAPSVSSLPDLPFTELRDEDAILNFIFDPSKSFIGSNPAPASKSAASTAEALERAQREDPLWSAHVTFTDQERAAVQFAEAGNLDGAKEILDRLCSTDCPDRASSFNNRAQLGRLMADKLRQAAPESDAAEELDNQVKGDLDRAITLGTSWLAAHPESEEEDAIIGPTRKKLRTFAKKVLQQAYTQRAVYHKSKGNKDAQLRDLQAAAGAGSALAQAVATGSNPYATLCSDTVAIMLQGQLNRGAQSMKMGETEEAAAAGSNTCPATSSSAAGAGAGSS